MNGIPKSLQPESYKILNIEIIDTLTNMPVNNMSTDLVFTDNNQLIKAEKVNKKLFVIILEPNKKYDFTIKSKGYFVKKGNVTANYKEQRADLKTYVIPLTTDTLIKFKNITFNSGSSILKNSSFIELDKIGETLSYNNHISIEIHGHTDVNPNTQEMLILSKERVVSVKTYLMENHNIKDHRIILKWYGNTQPIFQEPENDEQHEANRRVEFKLIKK